MTKRFEVYAGTAGHSAWFSNDLGVTWVHPNSHSGMYLETRVWCFAHHPKKPQSLLAGTDQGLFEWQELNTRWHPISSPMQDIWAITYDPENPDIVYAGTRPAKVFKSFDGGMSWEELQVPNLANFSEINLGPTRCTQIVIDPKNHLEIWLSVEIGGIFHSCDGGINWQSKSNGLESKDVHGIAITYNNKQEKIVLATTNRGIHRSFDNAENWHYEALPSEWQYTRNIILDASPDHHLWLTNGNGPPGSTGSILKSMDFGASWEHIALPKDLNSTPWCISTCPESAQTLFMATNLGQLFRSDDTGHTWIKLPHEFGEVRALLFRLTDYPDNRPNHSITQRQNPFQKL